MNLIEFLKVTVKKNNTGVLIWIGVNTILCTWLLGGIFAPAGAGGPNAKSYLAGFLVYLLTLVIALSPCGDSILRLQNGCHKIKRLDQQMRLRPLFEEVYRQAMEKNPRLPADVKLYLTDDSSGHAFALGRKTIGMSRALLEASDEEIKAVLTHEFAHLSNRDTEVLLIVSVGNLIVTAIVVTCRVIYEIVSHILLIMAMFSHAVSLGEFLVGLLSKLVIDCILGLTMYLWTKLGIALCMQSTRQNEYIADAYTCEMGYGYAYCAYLDRWGMLRRTEKKGLLAALDAAKPSADERIARMQRYGCAYGFEQA